MERAKGAQVKEKSNREGDKAMAAATSAAIFAFLAHPLSLLRHVAHACAGYLGLKGLKPSAPALLAPAAAACQQGEEDSMAVVQVRSRSTPQEGIGGSGGRHH
ncbi:unnamed protein product [Urochloa decumbens]|uniref:Uncharacterized protein n=1 Tax=Urochloa decumbens TaxID=240449 RepID=A0ABC9BQ35_9POAL